MTGWLSLNITSVLFLIPMHYVYVDYLNICVITNFSVYFTIKKLLSCSSFICQDFPPTISMSNGFSLTMQTILKFSVFIYLQVASLLLACIFKRHLPLNTTKLKP